MFEVTSHAPQPEREDVRGNEMITLVVIGLVPVMPRLSGKM